MIPHKKQQQQPQQQQMRTPTTTTTASMNMKAENVKVEIKNNNNNNTHVKTTKLVRASNKSRENKYVQTQLTAVSNERELKVFTSYHYSDKIPLAGKTSHHNYCQGLTTSSGTTSAAERRAQLRADFFKTSSTLDAEAKDNNNWLKFQTEKNTVAKQKLCLEQKTQHSRAFQRTQLTRKQYFPKVHELVAKFEKQGQKTMIVNNMAANDDTKEHVASKQQIRHQHQKQLHSPLSDEGCNLAQSPYCSSDEDNESNCTASTAIERPFRRKEKVARSASSDSALGLEVDETTGEIVAVPPNPETQTRRRMTLTVTDLPLRQALLPLAEPHALPDLQQTLQNLMTQTAKPSKVLLEERVVELPIDEPLCPVASSRRESAQSCMSDYPPSECSGVRYMRTPSVVVSDYSDDIMCGITLEEIEYFRAQRVGRRCSSLDTTGTEKDGELHSDVSAASSCSNLYYCGSTISALDGSECYINGERMPLKRKSSDCSDSSAAAELEDITSKTTTTTVGANQTDLCALLAAQHLDRKSASAKKVGLTPMVVVSNADNN